MSSSWGRVLDERKKLVEKIIENMKKGYVMPKPGWDKGMFASGRIENPVSHARYRGVNYVKLYIDQIENGYTDGRYMTYTQAQSMGWQVKKGEVGIRLEKYIFEKTVEEKNEETGKIEKKKVPLQAPMVNQFVVFHASQIDGIPELPKEEIKPLPEDAAYSIAENFMKSSECPIIETGEGRAYYSPSRDEIHLPFRNAFLDSQSFLATELHEMIHSTGAKNRLNRNLNGGFGSVNYAKEELRAELGAFFIQTDLRLNFDAQHFNSHTQYLESWVSVLENDPNELFRAISDSQKAADYLEERYERVKEMKQGKDVLFTYKINGFTACYNMGDITLEELENIYERTEYPYKNMPGRWIGSDADFAELEQSSQVQYSVTADVDNNEWKVYEINGIPEMERTDANTEIRITPLNSEQIPLSKQEEAAIRMAIKRERKEEGAGVRHLDAWFAKEIQRRRDLGISFPDRRRAAVKQVFTKMREQSIEHKETKKTMYR